MARILIEGSEEELRRKAPQLLKAITEQLAPYMEPVRARVPVRVRGYQLKKSIEQAPARGASRLPPSENIEVKFDTEPGLAPSFGAENSMAGRQAVQTGTTGPNLYFGAPPAQPHAHCVGMEHLEAWIASRDSVRAAGIKRYRDGKLAPVNPLMGPRPQYHPLTTPPQFDAEASGVKEWLERKHREKFRASQGNPWTDRDRLFTGNA